MLSAATRASFSARLSTMLARRLEVPKRMPALTVPRGETAEFYTFLGITAQATGDELIIDRRRRQRRRHRNQAVGNRQSTGDRRGPVPAQWDRDEVMVID